MIFVLEDNTCQMKIYDKIKMLISGKRQCLHFFQTHQQIHNCILFKMYHSKFLKCDDEWSLQGKNEFDRRKMIGKFFLQNWSQGKSFTVKKFIQQGVSHQWIYTVIQHFETQGNSNQKSRSGKLTQKIQSKVMSKVISSAKHKIGVST